MYPNTSSTLRTSSLKSSYRDHHRRRYVVSRFQSGEERRLPIMNEVNHLVKLRRRRARSPRSFYDNNEEDENEPIVSKWTIVRQRLPDILAFSQNYKPTSVRAQLVLLVALMNKQTLEHPNHLPVIHSHEHNKALSHIIPTNVVIDISGRNRLICLKSIPPEQMIYVDVDNLSFSVSTRQLILAISQGNAHETWKYCPPAISDMLIDISKAKVYDDRRQYKRAQFKMRLGQMLFLVGFMFIILMMIILVVGATKAILKMNSGERIPYLPIPPLSSNNNLHYSSFKTSSDEQL